MGWMATAVLLISTCIALKVYVDFGGSICALVFTFLVSATMQLMALGSIYLVIDALCGTGKKSAAIQLPKTIPKGEPAAEASGREQMLTEQEEKDATTSPGISEDEYEELGREHSHAADMKQARLTDSVLHYTEHVFAPFLELDQLRDMLEELRLWCGDPRHKPREIELRHTNDCSRRLKVLDMKHYIWNVGVRLGTRNGYTGEARAKFIKAMFPKLLGDNSLSSLCNQTHDPDRGQIVLDMPKLDSTDFTTMPKTA